MFAFQTFSNSCRNSRGRLRVAPITAGREAARAETLRLVADEGYTSSRLAGWRIRLDHCVIHVSEWRRSNTFCFTWPEAIEGAIDHLRAHGVKVGLGPVRRRGARGEGTSICFRDPDGSLLELISYD